MTYSKAILEDAKKVAKLLKKQKWVKGTSLFGSIPLGYADKHTEDFDLFILYDKKPSPEKLRKVLEPAITIWDAAYDRFLWISVFDTNNSKHSSVVGKSVKEFRQMIESFRKKSWPIPQDLITYSWYSDIWYDPQGILKNARNLMKKYPEKTMEGEIAEMIGILRFTRGGAFEVEYERGNWDYVRFRLSQTKEYIDKVVYAINKEYYPGPKWVSKDYPRLKILPKGFIQNINKFNDPNGINFKNKIEILREISEETLKVVRKEAPHIKIKTKF
jgi:hypothetical protein